MENHLISPKSTRIDSIAERTHTSCQSWFSNQRQDVSSSWRLSLTSAVTAAAVAVAVTAPGAAVAVSAVTVVTAAAATVPPSWSRSR